MTKENIGWEYILLANIDTPPNFEGFSLAFATPLPLTSGHHRHGLVGQGRTHEEKEGIPKEWKRKRQGKGVNIVYVG